MVIVDGQGRPTYTEASKLREALAEIERLRCALRLIASHERALIMGDAYNYRSIARQALNPNAPSAICEQENACEQSEGA